MPDLNDELDRTAALEVPCPHCHAPTGTGCRRPFDGRELVNLPAHLNRIARGYAARRTARTRGARP